MSKQFLGVIAAIVLGLVAIFAFSGNKAAKPSSSGAGSVSQHVQGKNSGKVTLTEYGDFQCPYCGQYYPTLKQIETEFDDKIQFQFRNFPLTNLHPNGFAASRAAEAASLQGKFWEMHDLLYENQQSWSGASATGATTFFAQYASQLGLNVAKFKTDAGSSKVNDIINADMAAGSKLNVQGTPSFFIDGKAVQIGNSVPAFEKVINQALAKKAPTGSGTTSQTTTKPADTPAASDAAPADTTSGQ